MAIDFIHIARNDGSATYAQDLLTFRDRVQSVFDLGDQILGVMNHNHDGVDFSPLEMLFGIPPGEGQTVFNFVNGTIGALRGVFQTDTATIFIHQVG